MRERLNLAELSPAQQDEITAELASHLDELCEKYRTQGLSESEARRFLGMMAFANVEDVAGYANLHQ